MTKTISVKKFNGIDQFRRKHRWSSFQVECLMKLEDNSWRSRRYSQGLFIIDSQGLSRRWISSRHDQFIVMDRNNLLGVGDESELL